MRIRLRRLLLEIAAFLIVGAVLLAGAAVWRLSSGPVSLTFLTSTIEDALNPPGSALRVAIGDTELTWGGWERAVDLVARDVILSDAEGREIAALPRLAVGLSIVDVAEGTVRPTSVDLLDAQLVLIQRQDGRLAFAVNPATEPTEGPEGTGAAPAVQGALLPRSVIDQLGRPPDGEGLLGGLTRIVLTNSRIWFINRVTNRVWRGRDINAVMVRDQEGLDGKLSGRLLLTEGESSVSASLTHVYGEDLFSVTATVREAPLGAIGRIAPPLADWLPAEQRADLEATLDLDGAARPLAATARMETPFATLQLAATHLGYSEGEPEEVAGELVIDRLEPARLADAAPALAAIGALDAPLTGAAAFRYRTSDGRFSLDADLAARQGVVLAPAFFPDGLVIFGAEAQATLARGADGALSAEIGALTVDLGGPRLSLAGSAAMDSANGLSGRLDARLTDLPMQQLDAFWPPSVAIDARDWVVPNIPRASVDEARLDLAVTAPEITDAAALAAALSAPEPPIAFERLGGEIAFRDAVVDYLAPLTPAEGVSGRATFDLERFDIDLVSGAVGAIAVEEGRIEITGFQNPDQVIAIDLALDAPVPDALALLDAEPFRFVSELGLDASQIAGTSKTRTRFSFPLIDELQGSDVRFEATAELAGVRVQEPTLDLTVTADAVDLFIDNAGLDVSGAVALDGVETALVWRENFEDEAPFARSMSLEGRPSAAELASFGLAVSDVLTGPVGAALDYRVARSGEERLTLAADLTETAVDLDRLNWAKPPGRAAQLEAELTIPVAGDYQLTRLRLEAAPGSEGGVPWAGLEAELSLAAPRDFSGLTRLDLNRLTYGPHAMRGTVRRGSDGVYAVELSGTSIDVSGLIGDEDEAEAEAAAPHPDAEEAPGPPIALAARFDAVTDDAGRRFEAVALDLEHDGEHLRALQLDARIPDGGAVAVDFAPDGGGVQRLRVASDNAGGALSALDWTARIAGGALLIEGEQAAPGAPLSGRATIERFTLERAPVLAKLLEFMSLTGVLSSLTQSGLDFDKAETDFVYDEGVLTLSDARAYGGAIGITVDGTVDLETDALALKGTVAPMYSINQVLKAIPILGQILTGGEGLFAANYAIEGPIEEPRVAVNPLSVLAPGFLRDLFGAPTPRDPDAPPEPGPRDSQGN
ncbi:MAG: AsmA-like C-terminal region-containing protein [Alphaproteobacteria bacterium]|nr:AsmA-like C-terminal region-containing protein [Alphaproteobacteria bacterium]